jgi:hypothetical protein
MYDRLKKSSIGLKGLNKTTKDNLRRVNSPKLTSKISTINSDYDSDSKPTSPNGGAAASSPLLSKKKAVINIDQAEESERDLRLLSKRSASRNKGNGTIFSSFSSFFDGKGTVEDRKKLQQKLEEEENQRLLKQEEEEEARRLAAQEDPGEDDDDGDDALHLAGIYIDVAADSQSLQVGGGGGKSRGDDDDDDDDAFEDNLQDMELGEITKKRRKREMM